MVRCPNLRTKVCQRCGKEKDISHFLYEYGGIDDGGYLPICKECQYSIKEKEIAPLE